MTKFDSVEVWWQKHGWHEKAKCLHPGVVGDFMATQTTKMQKMIKSCYNEWEWECDLALAKDFVT
jgi:hypothetical protein